MEKWKKLLVLFPLGNLNSENIKWEKREKRKISKNRIGKDTLRLKENGLYSGGYFWQRMEREKNKDFRVGLRLRRSGEISNSL